MVLNQTSPFEVQWEGKKHEKDRCSIEIETQNGNHKPKKSERRLFPEEQTMEAFRDVDDRKIRRQK